MSEEQLKKLLDRAPLPMLKKARRDPQSVQLWLVRYDKWYMDVNSELYGRRADEKWATNPLDTL